MLGISEWPGNETRPKLCWVYQRGLGMRLGQVVLGCPGNEARPEVLYYP